MKKAFISSILLTLFFIACNEEVKKLEHEYAVLFEKEYAEVENSERYKTFKERYQLLYSLSEEVNNAKEIDITEIEKVDTLCFIPPNEEDLQIDQKVDYEMAGKKDARPFSTYINQSKEVNATIVAEGFHQKSPNVPTFSDEKELHLINNMLDKTEYMAAMLPDTAKIYEQFSAHRILMDRVNNSRYFLFLKDMVNISSEYDKDNNKDEFSSGVYMGVVYVYDVLQKKFINSFTIGGANSETIEGRESSMDFSINSDLNDNINKGLEQGIKEKFGLRGEVTGFYKP